MIPKDCKRGGRRLSNCRGEQARAAGEIHSAWASIHASSVVGAVALALPGGERVLHSREGKRKGNVCPDQIVTSRKVEAIRMGRTRQARLARGQEGGALLTVRGRDDPAHAGVGSPVRLSQARTRFPDFQCLEVHSCALNSKRFPQK